MRKKAMAFLVPVLMVFMVFTLNAAASGIGDGDYEAANIALKGEGGARGEAVFRTTGGFMPLEYTLGVTVYGLEPNSIYSVWLVDSPVVEGREPLGIETNRFKTDGSGKGRYVTSVSHLKLRDWRALAVYRNAGKDPENAKEMKLVLKGYMRFY